MKAQERARWTRPIDAAVLQASAHTGDVIRRPWPDLEVLAAYSHTELATTRAPGAPSVRLPLSSVEPTYGLNSHVLVTKVNHYPDRGRPAPRDQHTLRPERTSLSVRLPGEHLHLQLRRSSWDGPSGRAGSSA
jgi:hypothetical protein